MQGRVDSGQRLDQDGLYHPAAVSVCHGERDGWRERGAACGGLPPLAAVRPVHGDAQVFQGAVVDVLPSAPTAALCRAARAHAQPAMKNRNPPSLSFHAPGAFGGTLR